MSLLFAVFLSFRVMAVDIPGGESCLQAGPCVATVSLKVQKNNFRVIQLSSLAVNLDGTDYLYFSILEQPSHGKLTLEVFGEPYGNKADNFEPYLHLRYSPNQDFLGRDQVKFMTTDVLGRKSNTGVISFEVGPESVSPVTEKPKIFEFTKVIQARKSTHVNLMGLTFHPQGVPLQFDLQLKDSEGTLKKTNRGVIDSYFNYVTKWPGSEVVQYKVFPTSNVALESIGTVTLEATGSLMRSRLGGYSEYLKQLTPMEVKTEIIFLGFLVFGILCMSWICFSWASDKMNPQVILVLRCVFVIAFFVLGFKVLTRQGRYTISALIMLGLVPGLIQVYLSDLFERCTRLLKNFFNGPGLYLFIFIALNSLAIFYFVRNVTFPSMTFDGQDYLGIYYTFKHKFVSFLEIEHSQRIMTPFLASLLPTTDPVVAFKTINLLFFNAAILLLVYLWRELKIPSYLICLSLFWLFLHQYGILRFSNFWATNVDSGSLFFSVLIAMIFIKKKPWLLAAIGPLASLQRNNFPILFSILLAWEIVTLLNEKSGMKEFVRRCAPIVVTIILSKVASIIPMFLTVTRPNEYGSLLLINSLIFGKLFDQDPLMFLRPLVMVFNDYGGFLILGLVVGFSNLKKMAGVKAISAFTLASGILTLILCTDREIFLAYPFAMTLILFSISAAPPLLLGVGLVFSLPILGLYLDFPFSNGPVMVSAAPYSVVASWGVYWIFVFILIKTIHRELKW